MLKHHDSSAIVAVSDLARARDFYSNVLGLELAEEGAEEWVADVLTGANDAISRSGLKLMEPGGANTESLWCSCPQSDIALLSPLAKRLAEHII